MRGPLLLYVYHQLELSETRRGTLAISLCGHSRLGSQMVTYIGHDEISGDLGLAGIAGLAG
jgi:hypothetical protein